MVSEAELGEVLRVVDESRHRFEIFQGGVASVFRKDPTLNGTPPIVHSIKERLKATDRLKEKIQRKSTADNPITTENVFERITDLAGVRVLHLHQQQFSEIHRTITGQLERNDWVLLENPIAYTWDPESRQFFETHELRVEVKESFYTSIHYVVKPRHDSEVCCEIQVRTLFEEIWGEIDHLINYPNPTDILACREQLRVLARLVGAGSRLADSIFRTFHERGAEGGGT